MGEHSYHGNRCWLGRGVEGKAIAAPVVQESGEYVAEPGTAVATLLVLVITAIFHN